MRDDVARAAALRALEIAREAKAMKAEKGDKGDPGEVKVLNVPVPGEQGPVGPRGAIGPAGPRGFQGVPGPTGQQGPRGEQGEIGPQGKSGKDGKDGAAGPKGERGPKGDKGDTGEIGPMPKHERKGLMFRFEKAPGQWGEWIVVPTGGGGGGRDDKLTDRQKELVEIADLIRTQGDNTNKFIKTVGGVLQWDTLDGSDINLSSPPVIGNVTPNAATFTTLTATGQTSLGGDTSNPAFRANALSGVTRWIETSGSVAGTPQFQSASTGAATGMNFVARGAAGFNFSTNTSAGTVQAVISHTASAVNYVQVTGAATAAYAQISAQGSDTNTGVLYTSKGTGEHRFSTAGSVTAIQFRVLHTNSPQNYCAVIGSAAGVAPQFQVLGTDTNIDLALTPKGTGLVRFGTRTASADAAITGYIEIKDSGGTTRRLAVIG